MKTKPFLVALALISSYVSFGNDSKSKVDKSLFSCTMTSSSTKSGTYTDCDGNAATVSVTSSCTDTQATCEEASATSGICAGLKASSALREAMSVLVKDCG